MVGVLEILITKDQQSNRKKKKYVDDGTSDFVSVISD